MYLLEGVGELHQRYGLKVGDVMIFAHLPNNSLVVSGRPMTQVVSHLIYLNSGTLMECARECSIVHLPSQPDTVCQRQAFAVIFLFFCACKLMCAVPQDIM